MTYPSSTEISGKGDIRDNGGVLVELSVRQIPAFKKRRVSEHHKPQILVRDR